MESTGKDQKRDLTQCTAKTCGGRGVCRIDDMGKVRCDCYKQYYGGKYCDERSEPCKLMGTISFFKTCLVFGSRTRCSDTYGVNNCICEKPHYGRSCELVKYLRYTRQGKGIVALMPLEPESGTLVTVSIGVVSHGSADSYEIVIDGVTYFKKRKDFKDEKSSRHTGAIRHLLSDEPIRK